ncbi:MAG: hypothetical protein IJ761_06175 [Bacteroidales bacterium]|nr:hypothetical protein [Bacteroidales bacterium]MBR1799469.1 hypothetical protein [Bacteroidales bacterium]
METRKVSLLTPVIMAMLFNPIFGILSIIYAVKGTELYKRQDKEFGDYYALMSKNFLMLGYTVSIILITVLLFATNFSTPSLIGLVALGVASIITMLTVDM